MQANKLVLLLIVILSEIIYLTVGPACCLHGFSAAQQSNKEGKTIMNLPSYIQLPESPVFAEDEFGVKICFSENKNTAKYSKDEPWPVFGGYMVGRDLIDEFGDEISANIVLVVTHKETRGVFVGGILKDEPLPKRTSAIPETGGRQLSAGSYFNIDLKRQCNVPAQKGKYWVVAILGRLTSPVLEFNIQ